MKSNMGLRVEIFSELTCIEEVEDVPHGPLPTIVARSARGELPSSPLTRRMVDGFRESLENEIHGDNNTRKLSGRALSRRGTFKSARSMETFRSMKSTDSHHSQRRMHEISAFGGPTLYSPRQEKAVSWN